MERQTGAQGAFLVQILGRQNATWQGTVTWLDGRESQSFRSVLELIHLMDSAIARGLGDGEPAGADAPGGE